MLPVGNLHHLTSKCQGYLGDDVMLSFRLQPIISLKHETITGYELLSRVQGQSSNMEDFFRNISDDKLLCLLQQQILRVNNSIIKDLTFINIKLTCLSNEFVEWLKTYSEKPLAFEIDYQDIQTNNLDFEEIESLGKMVRELKRHDHQVWLDDFDGIFSQKAQCLLGRIDWDGIKLDKSVLWSFASSGIEEFNRVINLCSIFVGQTIIEGIESFHQLSVSKLSGATYGQGFFWEDIDM